VLADDWETLSGWLNAWIGADVSERELLRARLIADHPQLAAEADALISVSGRLTGFLETPAAVLAARDLAKTERLESLLPAGSLLGPYRIAGLLARGGMGDVYRATDVRLHRDVALKVLAEARTIDPRRVERFMREARVTAALDHPNVIRVYDVGLLQDRAYLVAELLEGETLRARILRGPLPLADVLRIGIDVASGLAAAHAAGLVHRDLKPENIFLTRSGTTKLLDFGIAKLAQDESVRDGLSTLTGVVLGTSGYLAPEQIRGKTIDARADLFALGTILFEMLTGVRAFAREHIVETLHAILHDRTPDVFAESDGVPSALAAIVDRLLEKRPEARFQSSADLIAALQNVELPANAGSPGVRRFQRSVTLDGKPITLAVMPFRSIPAGSGTDLFELGLADVFISRLSQLADVRVLPLSATERLRAEDPRDAARRLNANRVLMVTLQRDSGLVRASVQLHSTTDDHTIWSTTVDTDASSIFSIQDIIVTRVIEELAPQLLPGARRKLAKSGTRHGQAFEAYLRGRVHVARPTPTDLRSAARSFEEALALDARYADAWAGLASAYKRMPVVVGLSADAFASAREAAARALELEPEHAEAHSVLGTVAFWYEWDYPRAEQLLRHALALQPSSADSQVFLAHLFSNTGRHDEALEEIRRARALDPAWPVPRALEGQFLFNARRYERALAHLNAIVEVAPELWTGHLFRVYALIALGDYQDALRGCDRVLELRRALDSSAPPYPHLMALKAYALAGLGQLGDAETLLAGIQIQADRQYPTAHSEALVLHALGRDDEALARLHDAVDTRDVFVTFLGVDHKWDSLRASREFKQLLSQVNLLDVSERAGR
jgi:serine/threonine protein kinase/tetratricopeptide (TPR) repeat protein